MTPPRETPDDIPALVQRLEALAHRYDMTHTERYEADSEAFYAASGFMAPGKDVPMAMGNQNERERRAAWDAWVAERNNLQQADIRAICAVLAHAMETLSRCPDCGGMGETTRDIDPGEVIRGARPITDADRAAIREQQIAEVS